MKLWKWIEENLVISFHLFLIIESVWVSLSKWSSSLDILRDKFFLKFLASVAKSYFPVIGHVGQFAHGLLRIFLTLFYLWLQITSIVLGFDMLESFIFIFWQSHLCLSSKVWHLPS